ncbi:InlB B-repeat-containing protein [Bifidobacterium panos]|uniref:3-carboxymuconate cyclase n=1 Tax=Bifidobacterium panos TaxID=2675321 RepID=A0ABX1SZL7_9BIFI|nr:InlB B-repeat-containing protein [Bifidobacterium sp. DSM 109963]NMN02597.1 3-carboxymuconate cyclase [Bifidobacterium sp. DSM 109963]
MVRFSSQSGVRRGLLRWLVAILAAGLAALMVLAVAVPAVWAADDKPSVRLNESNRTNVNLSKGTYQLGNAAVSGGASSYVTVQVDSGYFTLSSTAPTNGEFVEALDKDGTYVAKDDVTADKQYKYLVIKKSESATEGVAALDLQSFLRGLTFTLDSNIAQKVSVNAVNATLQVEYDGQQCSITLFNGHAYTFVQKAGNDALDWDEAFGAAKSMKFYEQKGHLLTIESKEEHNLIYKSFNNAPGWIGATRFITAAHAADDPDTYDIGTYAADEDYGTAWYWVTGPSAGTKIWTTSTRSTGKAPDGVYVNWSNGEPNALGGAEGCAEYGRDGTGRWNDLNNDDHKQYNKGFYVEFEDFSLSGAGSEASTSIQRVDVSYDLDGVTSTNKDTVMLANNTFTTTLKPADTSHTLDASSVSVSVGGKKLTANTDYTFNTTTGELTIPAAKVTGNVSVTAKAMRNVKFVVNPDTTKQYGSMTAPESLSVANGVKLSTATNPAYVKPVVSMTDAGKAAGRKFAGWQSSVDGAVYTVDSTTDKLADLVVSSDVTFTAVYADTDKMTVQFDYAGGSTADGASSKTLTGREGTSYDVPAPTRTGYTLAGWTTTSTTVTPPATTDKTATYTEDVKFTANWTANDNTVTFAQGDHGSFPAGAVTEYKDAVKTAQTLGEASVTAPTATADKGYTFVGWKSSEDGKVYAAKDMATYEVKGTGTGDMARKVTFTAQYVANDKCTVVFNANGGQIDNTGKDALVSMSDLKGRTYTAPKVLARTDGYSFGGWAAGSTVLQPGETGTYADGVTVYTAVWNADPIDVTFTVKNETEGEAGDGTLTAGKPMLSVKTGDALGGVTGYEAPVVTATEGTGKKFAGWKAGDGTVYTPAQIKDVKAKPGLSFTAVYEDLPKMTVVFDYNGGTLDDKSSSSLTGTQDMAYKADQVPVPTRNGYDFKGWTKDGKDATPSLKYENATYTAKWSATANDIKFTVDANKGEQTAGAASLSVNTDATLGSVTGYVAPTVSAKDGQVFKGWRASVTKGDVKTPGALYQPADIAALVSEPGLNFEAEFEDTPTVEVLFNYNGGTLDGKSSSSVKTNQNLTAKVPAPTRTGYTLAGWTATPSSLDDLAADATEVKLVTDATYTAKWTPNENTVKFVQDANDKHGTLAGNTEYNKVKSGDTVGGKPTVSVDAGYRFVGWVSSENQKVYSQDTVDAYVVSGANREVTFTAKYVPESSVEVHYNYAGGYNKKGDSSLVLTGLEGAEYSEADKTAAAEKPTRTGWKFTGWDKTPSTKYASVTYTAQWEVNPNTVTFLPGDNGTLAGDAEYTVNSGAKVPGEPTVSAKAGWTFTGWQSSEDERLYGANAVKDGYVVSGAKNPVTFTAQYVETKGAKAVFNANGGLIDNKDASVTLEGKQGTEYTVPNTPTREGYAFVKWADATGQEPDGTYADGVSVYVAEWAADSHALTFKQGDHGALTGTTDYQVATDAKLSDANVVAPAVEAEAGWSLVGWQSEEFGLVTSEQLANLVMPAKDVEFTAQYAQNATATVVFNADGGQIGGEGVLTLSGPLGTKYDVPANPTKDGYTFKGWLADGKKVDPSGTFDAASLVLTADWTADPHTVSFAKGDHGSLKDAKTYKVATDAKLKDVKAPEVAPEAGWSFVGWQSDEFGLVTSDELASLTMPGKDVVLTAQYVRNATGVVLFAYNGGTDKDGNTSNIQTGALGTTYTVPADPTRTGYTFTGWDRDVKGKTFTQSMLQVNATWKANTYKLTYKLDGGSDPKNPATYTYGVGATLKSPTKDGYTFAGWVDQDGKQVTAIGASDLGDKTLTAKWTKNPSTEGLNPDGGTIPSDWTGMDGNLPIPSRDGYKFDGWFDEDGNQVTTLKDAVGKNLTAKWTKIDDAFDPGDGTLPDDWTGADGELPTPTLPGYKFDGWYDEDGNLITTVKDAVGKKLHAKWTKVDDAFNPDGGTLPDDWTGEDGELPTPTRDGYRFDGWYDEDGNRVTTVKDAAGKKLTAHWTKLPTEFDVDGDVTIPDDWTGEDGKLPVPSKPGYKFDGWVDEDGNPVTNVEDAAGKKLHPKWTPVDDAFDTDGGNLPDGWTGEDGKLPLPSKPGYKFDGWYDEDGNRITNVEDAVGKKLHAKWTNVNDAFDTDGGNLPSGWTGEDGKLPLPYKPGSKFDGWYDEQGNLITNLEDAIGKKLHVKWTSVADAFDANGGDIPADWTGEDGKLPVPTREGYTFEGWYDDEGNLITNLEDAIGKKLHARWTKVNALASTGATGFAAGLTALALAATGFAASALRRRRSH